MSYSYYLLSAKSSLNDQIQGLEYGADEYITKPFSSAYLKARVDSLLKQRQILYDYYISKMREGEKDTSLMEQLTPSTPQVTHLIMISSGIFFRVWRKTFRILNLN